LVSGAEAAPAATAPAEPPFISTESAIDAGSGFGVSKRPSSGRMIRKKPKYYAVRMRAAIT
jgi:hypothetical protein